MERIAENLENQLDSKYNDLLNIYKYHYEIIAEAKRINKKIDEEFHRDVEKAFKNNCGTRKMVQFYREIIENDKTILLSNKINALQRLQNKNIDNVRILEAKKRKIFELQAERKKIEKKCFDDFTDSLVHKKKQDQQKLLKNLLKLKSVVMKLC